MGAKWSPPEQKSTHFCKIPHFCVQNAFWALFAVWTAKRAENRFRATSGSKNVPRTLCFPLFGARREKDGFLLKSCSPEKKKSKKCFYLRDIKTWGRVKKWKKSFSLTFARSAEPLISVTFWETFWKPRGGKTDFWGQKPKKCNFLEISQKIQFRGKKWGNCKIAGNLPKPYHFCFKNIVKTSHFAIVGAQGPQNTKISGISWNFMKSGEI